MYPAVWYISILYIFFNVAFQIGNWKLLISSGSLMCFGDQAAWVEVRLFYYCF